MFKGVKIQTENILQPYALEMSWSDRLREGVQELGWSKAELARRSGVPYDSVNKYLRGDIDQPRGDTLNRLASAIGKDPIWLRDGVVVPRQGAAPASPTSTLSGPYAVPPGAGTVSFGGHVQAGDFRPVNEGFDQDQGDHLVPASIFPHPAYPNVRQCAWRVHGDSMDQANIREGMWVVGGVYMDYVDKVGELHNGQYVVVERTRYGGSERELTVKEVQFARSGMHLVPRSSNERHKEFIVPLNEDETDGDAETISVVAVVFMAVNDFSARP